MGVGVGGGIDEHPNPNPIMGFAEASYGVRLDEFQGSEACSTNPLSELGEA